MAAPGGRVRHWRGAVAAMLVAAATSLAAAPIIVGKPAPEPAPEVEQISVTLEAETGNENACEIRCGVTQYRAECGPSGVPVCQCEYEPFARCRLPHKRKPRSR